MLFSWIVPAAIWLLEHFTAEGCSQGKVLTRRPPPGAAEICDKGNITANAASHVQTGTRVTLSCQLTAPRHPEQCRTALFVNSSELISNYGGSASTEFLVKIHGKHMFSCKLVCEDKKKLICGIDIESGNPPEEPQNVSCVQHGMDGHPVCTWERGRLTYIHTTYVIHLSNGTDDLCVSEEGGNKKVGSLALSKLNFDSTYTLVVTASNALGSAFSRPFVFTLLDIVKLHPPDFQVEFENSSATNCTLSRHGAAEGQHCRLRYRPLARSTWSTVERWKSEKFHLYGLEPHADYEFEVSCKIHPERGLWSNWRTYRTRTPEAVPTGILDVWYRQQDMDAQRQNISLFWKLFEEDKAKISQYEVSEDKVKKGVGRYVSNAVTVSNLFQSRKGRGEITFALSEQEARGRILWYAVTFEALGPQSRPAAETHLSTQTSYARVLPRGEYRVTVTAKNSRGGSPPASIATEPGTQDLPPPQKVSATAMGNSSIFVSWRPPVSSVASVSGYVVAWAGGEGNAPRDPPPAWVKLPASNLSTVIAEHVNDDACYRISVFALYRDGAGQAASLWGYSRAKAPAAGPQMNATPKANGILVSWEAIPAHQQRGCITGYNIYLQKKDGQAAPTVYEAARQLLAAVSQFHHTNLILDRAMNLPVGRTGAVPGVTAQLWWHIPDLQPGELYLLWMTALTAAGEGPRGNDQLLRLPGAGDWVTVVLICSFFIVSACVCFVPPARKAFCSFLSAFMPQWQSKAIPDPANATWAKNYMSTKAELILPSSLFLPSTGSFEEPETTQVEEAFVKTERPVPQDKIPTGVRRGSGEWPESGSGQEEPEHRALPSEADEQELPDLYKRMVPDATEHTPSVGEYIANPVITADPPPVTGDEPECDSLSVFPATFVTSALSYKGNLTLDTVKINHSSSTR